jgi:hypothetical protein
MITLKNFHQAMNFSHTRVFISFLSGMFLLVIVFSCGPTMDDLDDPTRLEVSHTQLIFESPTERKKLSIINTSNYPVNWSIESLSPDVVVTPFAGLLPANGVLELEVRWLTIPSNGEPRMEQLELEERWVLPDGIVDAVYDSKRDRIWALTPNRSLLEIDPINKQIRIIPLEIQGVKLSIHPAGDDLVVGHESAFSHLQLPSGQVIKRRSFPFKMHDLALAANNWLYVTDSGEQHSSLYCVNLHGTEEGYSRQAGVYSDATITLHPGGEYLMLSSTSLSPDDVYRVDIREGWARYQYDSPYHGDHRFGGKVWFDRTGDRFFTRSGNVHQFSEERQWDLTYVRSFAGNTPFVFFLAGQRFPRIFTVRDENVALMLPVLDIQPIWTIYNASDLTIQVRYSLPRVNRFVNGSLVAFSTEVPFGFVNQAENKFFLLERVRAVDHTTIFWNLLTIPAE